MVLRHVLRKIRKTQFSKGLFSFFKIDVHNNTAQIEDDIFYWRHAVNVRETSIGRREKIEIYIHSA